MATTAVTSYRIEFLDFRHPVIATFHMAMPSESIGMEYLCKIIELHPRLVILWADWILCGDCTSSRGCRSDEVGGPGSFLHRAWHFWCMNGFFLCRRLKFEFEFSPCDTASSDGCKFTTATWGWALPEVAERSHHIKLLPNHCDFCHWSSIFWSGQSNTSFIPEGGIRLQSARDTNASLVNSSGVCTDILETHGTGVFVGLLKHIEFAPGIRTLVLPMLTRKPPNFHDRLL